ncbi:glycoside hydrolase family 30 beta sandwich domain-containing protein [Candidatus Frankia alpina]|uniref:glycoside hydrolase family 30 beta sandwich domain-containing protein n=1 Tax=Candidatus Frankia alpina TaxID=2699483 RepID=UPI001F3A686E|nr:glycoside hydrolase family 30 beta sandwich domain-containing protein [Candidatus Frankia alpina]
MPPAVRTAVAAWAATGSSRSPGDRARTCAPSTGRWSTTCSASPPAPRGAVRIGAQVSSSAVSAVVFSRPDGNRSVLVHNRTGGEVAVTVDDGGGAFTVALAPHALSAFRWRG